MKRNIIITIVSTIISVITSFVLYDLITGYNKNSNRESRILKLAGKPAQTEHKKVDKNEEMENADMISEGSQFGVQYYDKHKKI